MVPNIPYDYWIYYMLDLMNKKGLYYNEHADTNLTEFK